MNIRTHSPMIQATESPRKSTRAGRTRRKYALEAFQQLEGRQLLATFSATYSASVPVQTTDYTAPISLPQFNPSQGTLTSIDLTFTATGTQQGSLTNVGSNAENFTFQESVNVALTDTTGTTTFLSPSLTDSQTYVFLTPNSPTAFGPFSPTSSTSANYTSGPEFTAFEGSGDLNLDVTTNTNTTLVGGGGNIRSALTTTAGATATVTYHYTASPVTLSGNVYEDKNGTGSLSPGDPPIPGTTLELFDSTGALVATTTTAADGTYSFTTDSTGSPLFPSTYKIEEIQPDGYLQGTNTVGTVNGVPDGNLPFQDIIDNIVLTSGQSTIGNNFGELLPTPPVQPVTLNGHVYEDKLGTGSLQAGDPPIGGVQLNLVDASGAVIATTTTLSSGNYAFLGAFSFSSTTTGAPIPPGTYQIDELQPFGYLQGTNTVGTVNGVTDGALTGVDQIGSIVLTGGQNSVDNNFGEVLPVTISGTVYEDVNKAGLLLPGDLPIPGTTVTLFSPQGVVATTTTNAFGVYSFTTTSTGALLPPSTYTLVETQPAGFAQGTNTIGTVNGVTVGTTPAQDIIGSIALTSGQSSVNNNFGELLPTPPVVVPSPMVTTVDRFGVHNQPTIIYLTFSQPLDPTSAQNVANYRIFGPTDGKFPAVVPIESAHYDLATNSVTLKLGERLQVHHPYSLSITGLTSTTGSPLIGSDGVAGSPYLTTLNRATLAGFTDIYGTFVPINHGKLYPAASSAGYNHTRFVPPAKLGAFAPANTAAYHVATGPAGEIPPVALKGIKPLPPANGSRRSVVKLPVTKTTTHPVKPLVVKVVPRTAKA